MTYTEALTRLSERSRQTVLRLFDMYERGRLTHDETVRLMATAIAQAGSRAAALADLSLAAELMTQLRVPVATVGVTTPQDAPQRLEKASRTLLGIEGVTAERIARLAVAETLEAGSRAYSEAIARAPQVSGWRRGVHGGACELCTWWAREGRVFQSDHAMPTHKGCTCTQIPVVRERTANYQTDRQAADAARTRARRNP